MYLELLEKLLQSVYDLQVKEDCLRLAMNTRDYYDLEGEWLRTGFNLHHVGRLEKINGIPIITSLDVKQGTFQLLQVRAVSDGKSIQVFD